MLCSAFLLSRCLEITSAPAPYFLSFVSSCLFFSRSSTLSESSKVGESHEVGEPYTYPVGRSTFHVIYHLPERGTTRLFVLAWRLFDDLEMSSAGRDHLVVMVVQLLM